ncbi:MAG: beta-propeller fold lactonase family protein [Nannocystaceae bacterium]|nr:beta-propeller fold lactonase family protein [Nannocystaceae bacterium]
MAVNPCTGQVYVAEWYGDNLLTYDPNAHSWSTVDIGNASLWDLVIDPTGSTLYVTDRSNDQVHVFDVSGGATPSATPEASIAVGDDPWGIDITPDGATVVVACEDDASVHFIDTATAASVGSLALDDTADPRDVDISADGTIAYIPNGAVTGDDGVYAVDISLQTIAATITLGPATQANAVAVKPQPVFCDVP